MPRTYNYRLLHQPLPTLAHYVADDRRAKKRFVSVEQRESGVGCSWSSEHSEQPNVVHVVAGLYLRQDWLKRLLADLNGCSLDEITIGETSEPKVRKRGSEIPHASEYSSSRLVARDASGANDLFDLDDRWGRAEGEVDSTDFD